jgi:lauroyl/myristoyl acyltransferase
MNQGMSIKRRSRRLAFWALSRLNAWAGRGGLPRIQRWGHHLGSWHYRLRWRRNQGLIKQLAQALPDQSIEQLNTILKTAHQVNDRAIFEVIAAYRGRLDRKALAGAVKLDKIEVLEESLRAGCGTVLLAQHMGNALAMATALSVHGLPVHVVYRESGKMPPHFFRDGLHGLGMHAINAAEPISALRGILKALRANGLVFVMLDQAAKTHGEALVFLGKRLYIPSGTIQAAQKTSAHICLAELTAVTPQWQYQFSSLGPMSPDRSVTEHLTDLIEIMATQIRKRPQWWSWHQRRWWRYAFNTPTPQRQFG